MAIDIENPGTDAPALKGALRSLVGGWIQLDSGVISSPQLFIDLDLPAEYISFKISCVGILSDNNNYPAYTLSADGGTTYINDTDDMVEAYKFYSEYHDGGDSAPSIEDSTNGVGPLTSMWVSTGDRYAVDIQVDPGETGKYPRISSHLWITNANMSFARVQSAPQAVGDTGRINAIRLGSSNAMNLGAPATVNLIGGAYTLLGMMA